MHMAKKKIACFLITLLLLQAVTLPVFAAPAVELELNAGSAVLIDAENGTLPVSYTHLDVYKRQGEAPGTNLTIDPLAPRFEP